MRLLLAVFGLLVSVCWGQQHQPVDQQHGAGDSSEVSTVELVVSTTFGAPVGKVLAILKGVGPQVQFRQIGATIKFEKIPFGIYDLEIQASGFSTRRERIGIYHPETYLWFGLFPSPIDEVERPELTGVIVPHDGKDLWVRLVPLYSGDFIEDRVAASGQFHLTGLHPGRYVLLVFNKDKLVTTKPVDFRGGKSTLTVKLSK